MQKTEKYQLNLVEPSDTFSPDPLNQNMEAVEQALDGLSGRSDDGDAQTAALAARVAKLEQHRFAVGSYKGIGGMEQTIYVGFTPKCVIIGDQANTMVVIPSGEDTSNIARIVTGGFYLPNTSNPLKTGSHPYIAFI